MAAGLLLFCVGCLVCYLAPHINVLMVGRFLQAFGVSVGSVLGQSICRDSFQGPQLGQVYSFLGSALAIFPALGPVLGGWITRTWHWKVTFLALICWALTMVAWMLYRLPETHRKDARQHHTFGEVWGRLIRDKRVIGLGLVVATSNGVVFSFFGEGPFFLMEMLHLAPASYGNLFLFTAASAMCGGLTSKRLNQTYPSQRILEWGSRIMLASTGMLTTLTLIKTTTPWVTDTTMIGMTILSQMTTMFGFSMVVSNSLALALVDYKGCVGTASSLFGFFYYILISLATLGMGMLHNGTLLPMPLYFFTLCLMMQGTLRFLVGRQGQVEGL